MSQVKLAVAQLTGFSHASKGFSITSLAESMGLTKIEWVRIREYSDLKELDKEELDKFFKIKY